MSIESKIVDIPVGAVSQYQELYDKVKATPSGKALAVSLSFADSQKTVNGVRNLAHRDGLRIKTKRVNSQTFLWAERAQ